MTDADRLAHLVAQLTLTLTTPGLSEPAERPALERERDQAADAYWSALTAERAREERWRRAFLTSVAAEGVCLPCRP